MATDRPTVPWQRSDHAIPPRLDRHVAELAFEDYHRRYPGQSFDRLHERGGFSVMEVIDHLSSLVDHMRGGKVD